MDGLGNEILAGAALALNEDGIGLAGGHLADKTHQLGHLARGADYVVVAGTAVNFAAQGLDFGPKACGFQGILDGYV